MKCENFKTKISKKKKCQELLKLKEINKEDKLFLFELIKEHPRSELKIGSGIDYIFIKKNEWGINSFFIKRIDGSETDFSYNQCLLPRTHLQEVKMACRSSIAEEMILSSRKGYISHHKIPFIIIFNLWFKEKKLEDLKIEDSKDNCVKVEFKDKEIAKDFRNFHNSFAEIEEVTKEEHNKLHSKKIQ